MKLASPTPELPVPDVEAAQRYYRDTLGFEIAWRNEEGRIGAVALGECGLFFRESDEAAKGGVFWIFADDVDEAHAALSSRGADVEGPPEDKPWGLRQFTLRDPYGNVFYVFHDL
ncbi:MAG: VOC family protein [Pseudomonadota bacterium]